VKTQNAKIEMMTILSILFILDSYDNLHVGFFVGFPNPGEMTLSRSDSALSPELAIYVNTIENPIESFLDLHFGREAIPLLDDLTFVVKSDDCLHHDN